MGCDIHLCIERLQPGSDTWITFAKGITLSRNYQVFGRLAGVRGETVPVIQPRGFPEDAWSDTREDFDDWIGSDRNTPTWLSLIEWDAALDHSVTVEYHAITAALKTLESGGYKTRVVLWFDN
jgi:hypothetical protein